MLALTLVLSRHIRRRSLQRFWSLTNTRRMMIMRDTRPWMLLINSWPAAVSLSPACTLSPLKIEKLCSLAFHSWDSMGSPSFSMLPKKSLGFQHSQLLPLRDIQGLLQQVRPLEVLLEHQDQILTGRSNYGPEARCRNEGQEAERAQLGRCLDGKNVCVLLI